MTPSLITRLCNIALKPGVSATAQLVTTRRICRAIAEQLDVVCSERRALRRQAGKLEAFLPFTPHAIAELEERAQEYRSHPQRSIERTRWVWPITDVQPLGAGAGVGLRPDVRPAERNVPGSQSIQGDL